MRIFVFLVFMLFISNPVFAQNSCLDGEISKDIAALLASPEKPARVEAVLKQVAFGTSKGLLKPELTEEANAVFVEYALRRERKCSVPQNLRDRMTRLIAITKDNAVQCEAGRFTTIIDRQHNTLKSSGGYEVFQQVIKTQIESNVTPQAREMFVARWDKDAGFRDRIIRAGLEINTMFSNNCANLQDPILAIVAEF